MQDPVMQDSIRPFSKLTQDNMAAFAAFATAPEVVAQSATTVTQWFQRSAEAASSVSGTGAYARLMQALMKNYTEFLSEVSQSATQLMSQGQAALVRQTQETSEAVAGAATVPSRRSR